MFRCSYRDVQLCQQTSEVHLNASFGVSARGTFSTLDAEGETLGVQGCGMLLVHMHAHMHVCMHEHQWRSTSNFVKWKKVAASIAS